MGRFSVTVVLEVPPGKSPRGADVLDRTMLPERAVHRFSYCDGRTLTAVVDWRTRRPEDACEQAVLGIRRVWAQITGQDPGRPLSVRVRPLDVRSRVSAGAPEFHWFPGAPLLPVLPGDAVPGPDDDPRRDDGGGLAGVREPRRPRPGPGPVTVALEEPRQPLP
jgi:hypothetical protein